MRPKLIAVMILAGAMVLAGMFLLRKNPESKAIPPAPDETANQEVSPTPAPAPVEVVIPTQVTINSPGPEQQPHATVEAVIERLTQLSQQNDPASVPEMLAALTYPNKEVRQAAIEATTQVGDSTAIPALKAASEQVTDTDEKAAFSEAIELLSVPPVPAAGENVAATPE